MRTVYAFVCIRNFNSFSGISNKLMESKNRKQFQTSRPDQRHILLLLLTGIPNQWVKYGTRGIKVFGHPCQCFYTIIRFDRIWIILFIVILCSSTVSRPRQSSSMRQTDFTIYLSCLHTWSTIYYLGIVYQTLNVYNCTSAIRRVTNNDKWA